MSFTFAYVGPLMKETTYLLNHLDEQHDWKEAEKELYNSGLIFSEKSTEKIVSAIKKRFNYDQDVIPNLDYAINVAKSNMNSISKAEIFYVYLYNSDILVSTMVDFIGEIYESIQSNPIITRTDIKNLLVRYLERENKKISQKSVENWIGRFLALLKEIKILIPHSKNSHIMNFGGVSLEAWTFFVLHAHFQEYRILDSKFMDAFQLKTDHIVEIIKRLDSKNWIQCTLLENDDNTNNMEIDTTYRSLKEWLNDL